MVRKYKKQNKNVFYFRPFQDATQGESAYTISVMDCLQAFAKARELGFFNFQDFDLIEYDRLDKIQGGDLNWIVPGENIYSYYSSAII